VPAVFFVSPAAMTQSTADAEREMLSLLTARVRDTALRQPLVVDGGDDLVNVCRRMADARRTGTLVRDGTRLGIFTTTDLRDALLNGRAPESIAVREFTHFSLIEIDADANLFEALWSMVHHRVHRLIVRLDGDAADDGLGVLSQAELVGFVSNHSHVVALQIDDARSVDDLAAAARRIDALVTLLHDGGLRIERVAHLVGNLNRRLVARLWGLLAPADLVAHSCLLVMGSEGRGEQIQKTDQDNALLLRDGFECADLQGATRRLNEGLAALGWPPCPGDIMLTNPRWCAPVARFRETMRDWVHGHDPEGPMHLAIFFDAAAVAGDATLLDGLRRHLDQIVGHSDAFIARFAAAADQFDAPNRWWARLTGQRDEQPLDLKKLGTFPIVHGVRALCLAHGVRATATTERLALLEARGQLEATLARDLTEALHYLMGLKLRHQLRQRAAGLQPGNLVRPSELSTLERDQFKGALEIVGRFRAVLRQRLRLDAL
jgi:CBS domain-containing protein